MKRTLSLVLSLIMILGIFTSMPVTVSAASVSDLTFKLNGDGRSYSVTDCKETASGALVVPGIYKGLPVATVGSCAFCKCVKLTSITLPDSITFIDYRAFGECENLTSITIPDGVTSLGAYAFTGCTSLTSVNIPDSISTISEATFQNCTSLKSIKIPDSVTCTGNYPFENCDALTSVEIPDSFTKISFACFSGCDGLTSVIIPDSVTSIDEWAFNGCKKLKTIYYCGTKIQWNKILIGQKNEPLYNCNIVYDYAPAKPATPKASTTNAISGVQISWNKVAGATKYNVYRRQSGYKTWTLVGTTTSTTLLDKNVKSGVYYCYSVRAYNSAGKYSDYISSMTSLRKYMAVPKLTGISNATNGLYIKWNAVAGVTNGYRVYRRAAGVYTWTYLGTTKNTYYTDTAVKNRSGEYYRYTVIADGGYHSKFDTTGLYLMRLSNPAFTVDPSNAFYVSCKPVKGATKYRLYMKSATSEWKYVTDLMYNKSKNTYELYLFHTPYELGVPYTFAVRAQNSSTLSWYNTKTSTCYCFSLSGE